MELGFGVPVAGAWATPANQVRVARRAEELGYRSLWTFQRLVVPEVPDERSGAPFYQRVQDAVVPLAFLAGQTNRIRLGTAVLIVPFFSPALLAKQLATLDIVSGGRLSGRPPPRRPPKRAQRPRPPLLLGGTAKPALRRAGRLADGWVSGSTADLNRIGESIEVVREAAREAGRDPDRLRFVCRGAVKVRPAGRSDRAPLSGSFAEIRGDLDTLAAQGVTEVFVDLNFDPEIGAPGTDPAEALRRAEEALEALAPG